MRPLFLNLGRNALAASLIFFGLCFAVLPNNSEVFALLTPSETQLTDSAQEDAFSQNTNQADSSDSTVNTNVQEDSHWFRLVRENGVPVKLQTSAVRFTGEYTADDGVKRNISVDLIGAIHLAEKDYYAEINDAFKDYDAVVFELVTSKGVDAKESIRLDKENKSKAKVSPLNIIAFSQIVTSRLLDLEYQLDGIDYQADNLVHGDMAAEDFILQLISNGDVWRFVEDTFFAGFSESDVGSFEGAAIAVICAQDRRIAMRRIMATELLEGALQDIEEEAERLEQEKADEKAAPEGVLIHKRNEIALATAVRQLRGGKTKVAIFYGAAHLPDLERKLENELGLKRDPNTRWFTAWNMKR